MPANVDQVPLRKIQVLDIIQMLENGLAGVEALGPARALAGFGQRFFSPAPASDPRAMRRAGVRGRKPQGGRSASPASP